MQEPFSAHTVPHPPRHGASARADDAIPGDGKDGSLRPGAGVSGQIGALALQERQECLLSLARHPALIAGDLPRALAAISEAAARCLGVERVSIWIRDPGLAGLRCVDRFEVSRSLHSGGEVLREEEHAEYFRCLLRNRVIAAHDAQQDPRTRSFLQDYFLPLAIRSVLDAPIHLGGKVMGVVWHEQVGVPRTWLPEEQQFAGSIGDLVALAVERSEHFHSEQRLRKSEMRLASVLRNLSQVVVYETGGDQEYVSDAIEFVLGIPARRFEEDRGLFPSLIHPADLAMVQREVEEWHKRGTIHPLMVEFRVRGGGGKGEYVWLEDHMVRILSLKGKPYTSGVLIDVTERRKAKEEKKDLEAQLIQAQKMEAIGTLAGGVAHDFNNLLTGILGYADVLKAGGVQEDEVIKAATVIEDAGLRAADLTRQLLGFARRGKLQCVPVDLNESVADTVRLLRHTIDKRIEVTQELHAQHAVVEGDPTQIQQVILNLAINARDAMPAGGRLVFSLRQGPAPETDAPAIFLTVQDSGPGVPPELQEKVFEPFFTTKGREKGTGMGLATVYGVVRNHGGGVRILFTPGEGACFEVWLPQSEASAPVPNQAPLKGKAASGHILLVDDEDVVRRVACTMLQRIGYRVTSVSDGASALCALREAEGGIDLVVLDLVMPGMGGKECFDRMRELVPGIKVVLATGHDLDGGAQTMLEGGVLAVIQKPYTIQDLQGVIAPLLHTAVA